MSDLIKDPNILRVARQMYNDDYLPILVPFGDKKIGVFTRQMELVKIIDGPTVNIQDVVTGFILLTERQRTERRIRQDPTSVQSKAPVEPMDL